MANTVKTTKRDRFEEIKTLCELVGETDRVDVEGIVSHNIVSPF